MGIVLGAIIVGLALAVLVAAPDMWWVLICMGAVWWLSMALPQEWEEQRDRAIRASRAERQRELAHRRRVELALARRGVRVPRDEEEERK